METICDMCGETVDEDDLGRCPICNDGPICVNCAADCEELHAIDDNEFDDDEFE